MLEPPPDLSEIIDTLGPYKLLKSIGKGGMGEVFLAYDTICGRKIALKKIRSDLANFPQIHKRFLHEARVTSQLMHPAIIPIYSIHTEEPSIYYSMPYVEGETLKQILKRAKENERKHPQSKKHQDSIPYLIRHFLQICQAVAYSHSKGVLHRDLKPENIIVGNYGQIFILDWGLAKVRNEPTEPEEGIESKNNESMTRLGKVVGTISFMAPERALGAPASIQTDIYSLGVILYQILTLTLPFSRKSLTIFKKKLKREVFIPPEFAAPYRDVPQVLSEIVKGCLAVDVAARYSSVDAIIKSLENYLEGKSEWFFVQSLNINEKKDWQFQENVLLAEHTAITRSTEVWDWVGLMISQEAFPGNLKIETSICLGQKGHGIGFLFCVPEAVDRRHLTEGYCLWIAGEHKTVKATRLLLSGVSVLEAPEISLKPEQKVTICIEKIDDRVSFYLNGIKQFSHSSHMPTVGTHVGILSRDADFEMDALEIYVGSRNIMVNCLAVPDAFLSCKLYDKALCEYRRIGAAFPGRAEGREALFRAGITILEEAKEETNLNTRELLFDKALEEFGKLRNTPGAPLEYLGKSYVYRELGEYEEEAKCFELAQRRYKNNPLLSILEEQVVFRMHETSRQNRVAAYHFIGIVVRFLKEWAERPSSLKLFSSLQKNWEVPFFVLQETTDDDAELYRLSLCLGVGFWLAKPYIIKEAFEELLLRPIVAISHLSDALFFLVELGAYDVAQSSIEKMTSILSENEQKRFSSSFEEYQLLLSTQTSFEQVRPWISSLQNRELSKEQERVIWFCMRKAIDIDDLEMAEVITKSVITKTWSLHKGQENLMALAAEYFLYTGDIGQARNIFSRYSQDLLSQENFPLYFVYGCYLAKTEGVQEAITHFSTLLDIAFPRSWVLGAHFLSGKLQQHTSGWFSRSFFWERKTLYQQLRLFWHSANDAEKARCWKNYLLEIYT
jgi:serine/threonine protein kinase